MRICLIPLLFVAGCGLEDEEPKPEPEPTCLSGESDAVYDVKLTTASGNCGAFPDFVHEVRGNMLYSPTCAVTASWLGCQFAWTENCGEIVAVYELTAPVGGGDLTGTMEVSASGPNACAGTYNATFERR